MMGASDAPRDAFLAAGIAPGRFGKERVARLTDAERAFYRWILERFAEARPPAADDLCDAATRLDVAVEDALGALAREDLVHHDPATGRILVAYPFSGRPTAHEVSFADGRCVHAMCAIDALCIPFMLGAAAEVVSRDPLTDEEIRVRIERGGQSAWQPDEAVVLAGAGQGSGPTSSVCCALVNFFTSPESAGRYLRENVGVRGELLSIPEALEAGRLVFGGLLQWEGS